MEILEHCRWLCELKNLQDNVFFYWHLPCVVVWTEKWPTAVYYRRNWLILFSPWWCIHSQSLYSQPIILYSCLDLGWIWVVGCSILILLLKLAIYLQYAMCCLRSSYVFWCAEKGSGRLTLADLEIASTLHDFSWSNLELQDMIQFFDSNHDGMVSCLSCSNWIGAIDNLHVHIACFSCPRSHGICSGTMVYGNS